MMKNERRMRCITISEKTPVKIEYCEFGIIETPIIEKPQTSTADTLSVLKNSNLLKMLSSSEMTNTMIIHN